MKTSQNVVVDGDTTGTLDLSSVDYQPAENFLGETVTITAKDENGNPVRVTGILTEVL